MTKNPGCLVYIGYIGDYTTQLYRDYMGLWWAIIRIPINQPGFQWKVSGRFFFFVAQIHRAKIVSKAHGAWQIHQATTALWASRFRFQADPGIRSELTSPPMRSVSWGGVSNEGWEIHENYLWWSLGYKLRNIYLFKQISWRPKLEGRFSFH